MNNPNGDVGAALRQKVQALRQRVVDLRSEVYSAMQREDKGHRITLRSKVADVSRDIEAAKQEFSAATLSDGLTTELDGILTFLKSSVAELSSNLKDVDTGPVVTTIDVPDVVTKQVLQDLDTKKNEEILKLAGNVKLVAEINNRINEKLDEGAEVMEDVDSEILVAKKDIEQAVSKMKMFQSYMKNTKVPGTVCVLSFILLIIVWSSKAFCSWGFTWQCP